VHIILLLLLDRSATASNILYHYCLIAVQLLRIYCTIIAWSRCNRFEYTTIIAWLCFDCSMLLLDRDATASNVLYYYCLIAIQLCQSGTYAKIVKTLVTISDQKPTYLRYERYNREIRITSIWWRKMTDCMSWSIKAI
jgi:hypothetical protein